MKKTAMKKTRWFKTTPLGGRRTWCLPVCALAVLAGCGHSEVRFGLNREGQTPAKDDEAGELRTIHDEAIVDVLYTMFGEPDAPVAFGGASVSGLDERKLRLASGPADDPQGRGLYRKHCVHCHGVTGDGNGPTARFLNPYPRDFRSGFFKFKSTYPDSAKPTRDDLTRTIREGINGTAMPSFKVLLRNDEAEALAEYVVYLSMRGRSELELRDPLKSDSGLLDDIPSEKERNQDVYQSKIIPGLVAAGVFTSWSEAPQQVFPLPDRDEAAIAKEDGAKLFGGALKDGKTRVECMKCHGPAALGDGASASSNFDIWNEPKWKLIQAGNGPDLIEKRFNLPLQRLSPRNLRLGAFRGGRRPVDVFRRIALGIYPSNMQAHATIKRDDKDPTKLVIDTRDATKLQPHEIWALVDYVLSLPYQEGGELRRESLVEGPHKERL